MTIKRRTVRALRDVRERLRDAAAARHAETAQAQASAQAQLEREHATLDQFLDQAADVLGAASSVHELDRFAASTEELRLAVSDAAAAEAAAAAQAEQTARELRERARQLRSVENLAERMDRERSTSEAKTEQKNNDEMAGRKR